MLVDAVLLAALPVEAKEAANRHPRLVVLMQEPAGVALHAQAPQPVPAHRLPEAPPSHGIHSTRGRVGAWSGGRAARATSSCGGGDGDGIGIVGSGSGGGGGVGGPGVKASLKVEAEATVVFHDRES